MNKMESIEIISFYKNINPASLEMLAYNIYSSKDEEEKNVYRDKLNDKINKISKWFKEIIEISDNFGIYEYTPYCTDYNYIPCEFTNRAIGGKKLLTDKLRKNFLNTLKFNVTFMEDDEIKIVDLGIDNKFLAQSDKFLDKVFFFYKGEIPIGGINYYTGDIYDARVLPKELVKKQQESSR